MNKKADCEKLAVEGCYDVISASAHMLSIRVILTFRCSLSLALEMKTEKPSTVATPSPLGLIPSISTSYVSPNFTGQTKPLPRLFFAFLGARFFGLIGHQTSHKSIVATDI